MIIYKTTNLLNGKIYVGKDTKNNPNYYGSGYLLTSAIKKYGKSNFKKEILEHCTKETINEREIFWIAKLDCINRNVGYNRALGGQGGDLLTNNPNLEEIRKKISISVRNSNRRIPIQTEQERKENSERLKEYRKRMTEEEKERISNKIKETKGKNGTLHNESQKFKDSMKTYDKSCFKREDYRNKISERMTGKIFSEEHRKNISMSKKGTKMSDEFKRKQSENKIGIPLSEKNKKNISIALTGRKLSETHKKNLSENKKAKVIRFDWDTFKIKMFNGFSSCEENSNVKKNSIKICAAKFKHKSLDFIVEKRPKSDGFCWFVLNKESLKKYLELRKIING